jgi:hypothetical protein
MATTSSRGAHGQGAPLVLRGTPENLVGILELTNDAEEPRRFRSLRLRSSDLGERRRAAQRRLMLRETVVPGERRRVPVEFSVDPATAPGRYQAVFADDRGEHRAEIEVLPQQRLGLLPDRIEIEAAPGETVVVPVVLSNGGNVALELSTLGVMVLEEDRQICLALQHALGASREGNYETFLNALVGDLAGKKTGFLRLRLAGAGITLDVGETRMADLELHVPSDVKPGRSYQARASVLNEPLFLKLRARQGGAPRERGGATRRKGEGA